MNYPIEIEESAGIFIAKCRDVPETTITAERKDEIKPILLASLRQASVYYMSQRISFPLPSEPKPGEMILHVPAHHALKLMLYNEAIANGMTKAEMARRLDVHQKQIDRLWSLYHSTSLDTIEAAFAIFGKRLQPIITDAGDEAN